MKNKYVYCKHCGKPVIGPLVSSLDELMKIRYRKELAPSCSATREYCLACYINHIKKDVVCVRDENNRHCVQNENGTCLYMKEKLVTQ